MVQGPMDRPFFGSSLNFFSMASRSLLSTSQTVNRNKEVSQYLGHPGTLGWFPSCWAFILKKPSSVFHQDSLGWSWTNQMDTWGMINPELVELGFGWFKNVKLWKILSSSLPSLSWDTRVKNAMEMSLKKRLNWLGIFWCGFPDPTFFSCQLSGELLILKKNLPNEKDWMHFRAPIQSIHWCYFILLR